MTTPMPTNTPRTIAELVEKWRATAKGLDPHGEWNGNDLAERYEWCADELQALATANGAEVGEAVSWRLVSTESRPKREQAEPEFIVDVMGRDGPRAGHFKPLEYETVSLWEATIKAITDDGNPPGALRAYAERCRGEDGRDAAYRDAVFELVFDGNAVLDAIPAEERKWAGVEAVSTVLDAIARAAMKKES